MIDGKDVAVPTWTLAADETFNRHKRRTPSDELRPSADLAEVKPARL